MSILPTRLDELLTFMELHAEVWNTNAAALNIAPAAATAFKSAAGTARTKHNVQLNAYEVAEGATEQQQAATRDARLKVADLIRTIKAFAETQANPAAIYALAQIPSPADAQPVPPPSAPTAFVVTLDGTGAITLRWKSEGAAGGFFLVERRIGASQVWSSIGGSGTREFVDNSLPIGTSSVTYRVRGARGNVNGPMSTNLTVQFGVGTGPTITGGTLTMAA